MRSVHVTTPSTIVASLLLFVIGCGKSTAPNRPTTTVSPSEDGLTVDPATGIPYALTFQFPVSGFDASDFGFGFGAVNTAFCKARNANGECVSYGYHLGRDALVAGTPVGTEVVAPADGIVRITTDVSFSGFGSDNPNNAAYQGCVIVLEHLFPNQQAVTTLLGHVRCESGTGYDPTLRRGNPLAGSVVRRGQYVAHVAHYWHGADQSTDWHHVHWGMRRGRFIAPTTSALAPYVLGYAARSELTTDPATGAFVHPLWTDPFIIVAANSDPATRASGGVQHHPSGALLQDLGGGYWFVTSDDTIASVSSSTLLADRYDTSTAVRVTDQEIACYRYAASVTALGSASLYVRPGTSTVAVAYASRRERYDFIRWESLLSWGFTDADIRRPADASATEAYASRGFRLLRPGTLVKADEASEVAIVTAQQTRLPIISGDVFEQAGFRWERVVSIPGAVLDQVAGSREARVFTMDDLRRCAVPPACPGGAASCGGGGPADPLPSGSGGISGSGGMTVASTGGVSGSGGMVGTGGMMIIVTSSGGAPVSVSTGGFIGSGGNSATGGISGTGGVVGTGGAMVVVATTGGISGTGGKPASIGTGGFIGSGGTPSTGGISGTGGAPLSVPLHLTYRSPIVGSLSIQGWWQPPSGINRAWDTIPCADANPSDDLLECDLPVPSGSPTFVFQVTIPGPKYWGDQSCDSGGCNKPLGSLTLTKNGTTVPYTFVPNGSGPPYYNGQVMSVP